MNTLSLPDDSFNASGDFVASQRMQTQVLMAFAEDRDVSELTFQGGSAILMCHGGVRLSFDLDFSGWQGEEIDTSLARVASDAATRIEDIYGSKTKVTEVKTTRDDSNVSVAKVLLKSRKVDGRPDVPLVNVKLEVADVPAYTSVSRRIRPLVDAQTLPPVVACEAPSELVADKVVSLCASRYFRGRDLWDIFFLNEAHDINKEQVRDLVTRKISDYQLERENLMAALDGLTESVRDDVFVVDWARTVSNVLVDRSFATRIQDVPYARAVMEESLDVARSSLRPSRLITFDRG